MIIRMKKISLRGPKKELKNTIDALKSTGAFELASLRRVQNEQAEEDNANHRDDLGALLGRIRGVLDFAEKSEQEFAASVKNNKTNKNKILIEKDRREEKSWERDNIIEYHELKKIAEREAHILGLIGSIEELSAKYYNIKAEVARNTATAAELVAYTKLDVNFNILRDTREAFVLAGLIPTDDLARFRGDFDLSSVIIKELPSSDGVSCVVFIGHNDDKPIVQTIYNYGFERCKFNFNVTAAEKIKELDKENRALLKEQFALVQKACISAESVAQLKLYYDYISNELNTEEVIAATLMTENFYVLNGWIVESAEKAVLGIVQSAARGVTVKIEAAAVRDNPPVLVHSSKAVEPYQSITNMYGAPGQRDIDPNLFVAFFYFLFFGVMIGDIGYGILMSVAAAIILIRFKPQKRGARDLIAIIGMGGISAILWGVFFGSVFGADTSDGILGSVLPKGVLNPIDNALVFLGLTLGLGFVHIIAGLSLKFYNLMRQGRALDAVCDALVRIVMLCGVGLFALSMLGDDFARLSSIGLAMAIGALAVLVLTAGRKKPTLLGKIIGGFGGAYSLVNYFSDILSYARLFGLGLVGAVIAMVANKMGGMVMDIAIIGPPLGVLVAVIFHLLNLAIGLLSAYVHNARLQFVEFFGKFYEGGGKPFMPLGSNLKYVQIKGVL